MRSLSILATAFLAVASTVPSFADELDAASVDRFAGLSSDCQNCHSQGPTQGRCCQRMVSGPSGSRNQPGIFFQTPG